MASTENTVLVEKHVFVQDGKDKAERNVSNFVTRYSDVVIKSKEYLPLELRQTEVQGRTFPSKPHDLSGLPTLLTPYQGPENKEEAESSRIIGKAWKAIEDSPNILVAHACNISSLIRILKCHYSDAHVDKIETAALMQSSPWITLLAREVISGSLVNLSDENGMKTTAPFGFLFNVPVECIWNAASQDLYIPMESTTKGPYDSVSFREIFNTTLEPTLSKAQETILQPLLQAVDSQYVGLRKLGEKCLQQKKEVLLHFYKEHGLVQKRGFMADMTKIQTPEQIFDGLKTHPYSEVAFLQETLNPNTCPKIRGIFINTDLSCLTDHKDFTVAKLFRADREIDKNHDAKFYFEQAEILARRLGVPLIDFAQMRKLAKQCKESATLENSSANPKTLTLAYDASKEQMRPEAQVPDNVLSGKKQISSKIGGQG